MLLLQIIVVERLRCWCCRCVGICPWVRIYSHSYHSPTHGNALCVCVFLRKIIPSRKKTAIQSRKFFLVPTHRLSDRLMFFSSFSPPQWCTCTWYASPIYSTTIHFLRSFVLTQTQNHVLKRISQHKISSIIAGEHSSARVSVCRARRHNETNAKSFQMSPCMKSASFGLAQARSTNSNTEHFCFQFIISSRVRFHKYHSSGKNKCLAFMWIVHHRRGRSNKGKRGCY